MTTATSLKLPEGLKERIQNVVEGTDETAHAFMLKAIRKATEDAEWMQAFVQDALAAESEVKRAGKAYRYEDVKTYWLAKAAGKKAIAPKPTKLR